MARRNPAAPIQRNLFALGEDLPLFAGAPYGPKETATFVPPPAAAQPALFDVRPAFGADEPTYSPKEPQS